MSNALYNLAQRVEHVIAGRVSRAIWPSEKAVFLALANDARDGDGGRSRLTNREVRRRTGLSERAVQTAYLVLTANGHITRIFGDAGSIPTTRVHPCFDPASAVAGVPSLRGTPATIAPLPRNGCGAPIEDSNQETIHQRDEARAAVFSEVGSEAVLPDPATDVFDGWDAMIQRAGLPGPITRNEVRRRAIKRRLGEEGLFRVLEAVKAVGRSDFLCGRKKRGQSDFRATFDWIFWGTTSQGIAVFTQLLEGNFNEAAVPRSPPDLDRRATSKSPPAIVTTEIDAHPSDIVRFRAALVARIGPYSAANWLDGVVFEIDPDDPHELIVRSPSAFISDTIESTLRSDIADVAATVFGRAIHVTCRAAPRQLVGASP